MSKLPPLKSMQAFEATARHLSFSLAAQELCVSQSAISHQIKSLEAFLNKKLFIRSNNKISLTGDGDIFFSVIKDCFKRMQTVTDHLILEKNVKLKVIAQTAVAVEWLAPRIPEFYELNPDISIDLSMTGEAELAEPSEYDVLVGSWPAPPNFISQQIREENWFPVCAPEIYKQLDLDRPQSLLDFPLISSENGQDWLIWIQQQKLETPKNLTIQHVSHGLLAAKIAQGNGGIAMSCDFIINDLIKQGQLIALDTLSFHLPWGDFFIHFSAGSHYRDKIEIFVGWLVDLCNEVK
ncbi:LysR family transcriptional regulator [Pseudoalteromonas sp. Of7M-16]|uniref:LysR family transcriptional regulator n=1 Tax=Pseudoalteromonas sp. Of7M-16 TaxID=2917756 RepID=UPI001EF5687C|nr:LysR family transcriptional regulator [Pseudoalteromonas sp. Of7M-16]